MFAARPSLRNSFQLIFCQRECHHVKLDKLSKFSFWKSQYQRNSKEPGFDWFLGPEIITSIIQDHITDLSFNFGISTTEKEVGSTIKYLDLGCGTSLVPQNVVSTSKVPIKAVLLDFVHEALVFQQNNLIKTQNSNICTVCADAKAMPFYSNTFHLVVDKGTLDALLKDVQAGITNTKLLMKEVWRVLKDGGCYIHISDEDPDVRIDFLNKLWNEHLNEIFSEKQQKDSHDFHGAERQISDKSLLHKKLNGTWNFKVLPSDWGQEYFVYWRNK